MGGKGDIRTEFVPHSGVNRFQTCSTFRGQPLLGGVLEKQGLVKFFYPQFFYPNQNSRHPNEPLKSQVNQEAE
jgi:hypothetical protein